MNLFTTECGLKAFGWCLITEQSPGKIVQSVFTGLRMIPSNIFVTLHEFKFYTSCT